jgi:hypothetical protein
MEGDGTYHYGIRVVSRSQTKARTGRRRSRRTPMACLSEHGFVSMAADGADRMRFVWLDGRVSARYSSHAEA